MSKLWHLYDDDDHTLCGLAACGWINQLGDLWARDLCPNCVKALKESSGMITDYSAPLTPADWGRRIVQLEGEVADLRRLNGELREEIEVADRLISERNRILDALPCPDHGQCVPYVLEWIEGVQERIRRLVVAGDGLYDRGEHHRDCLIPCTCGWNAKRAAWDAAKEG